MSEKLKVLDLFSGIGGFSLGLERTGGFETVAFCEIEKYPRKVLAKHWPDVPIYEDVKELTHERLEADGLGRIDLICGGYPCQPFSHAGERRGAEDDRHLWPEVKRLMATVRPRWGLFENVAGHVSMGLDEVLSDLEAEGYTGFPVVVPACAVDAPHRRDRVWIIAHANSHGEPDGTINEQRLSFMADTYNDRSQERHTECSKQGRQEQTDHALPCSQIMAHSDSAFIQRGGVSSRIHAEHSNSDSSGDHIRGDAAFKWPLEPNVGRVANGIPRRVDRLKGLGNAVVPQIPEIIGNAILETENV